MNATQQQKRPQSPPGQRRFSPSELICSSHLLCRAVPSRPRPKARGQLKSSQREVCWKKLPSRNKAIANVFSPPKAGRTERGSSEIHRSSLISPRMNATVSHSFPATHCSCQSKNQTPAICKRQPQKDLALSVLSLLLSLSTSAAESGSSAVLHQTAISQRPPTKL